MHPYGLIRRVVLWTRFCLRAKPVSSVHSPMIFKLMQNIKGAKASRSDFKAVEELRFTLKRDSGHISFVDHGDGKQIKTKSVCSIARKSAKSRKLCLWLAEIVKFVQPKNGIELGTSLGLSLAYQQLASPDTHFTSLEGSSEIADLARRNLDSLNLQSEVITGDFEDTLSPLLNELSSLEYAFIDGHHQQEPTLRYFEQLMGKLSPEGCIVMDDIYWSEGMQNAWKTIINDSRVSLSIDLFHMGVVFIRPGVEKQHFNLRVW